MKKTIKNTLYLFFAVLTVSMQAKENVNYDGGDATSPVQTLAYNCAVGTAQTLLDINNVRTTILNGGDMWWDLSKGRYEIPKGSGKHSMFAGALWIGGMDDNDQIKVAAQTYRQSGNDFWPGPLDNVRLTGEGLNNSKYGSTEASICAEYDKHFVILRTDVEAFVAWSNSEEPSVEYPDYVIPQSILNYPGNRTSDDLSNAFSGYDEQVGTSPYYALETLAPYRDVNGDGHYDALAGDYPEYNLDAALNCKEGDMLFGDQTLWWVYNDNGNTHTESGSETAIGLEIQAQAFAFSTNDEINNMTFYNYKMINRSHNALNETWFGQWIDPDLGDYQDDYVGCDVARGLGYCYNGDEDDGTAVGYGANPPAIGVDFFRGPLADEGDGVDNNSNGVIDEPGEQIIMSKFVYYNNIQNTPNGNPDLAPNYYNYLKGIWLDGLSMTYGGDGRDQANAPCNFMFPGDTDPAFSGQNWTEQIAGNDPQDRRFLQSAGPFTLEPGAVNTITTGVVWARANQGGAWASVELMRLADDKAQKLFDVCFEVLDGPDAPDLTIQELDQQLVLTISNSAASNNFMEQYVEADDVNIIGFYDSLQTLPYRNEYVFEGYQIFQLRDETVTAADVYNVDKARLVFQCDVKNFRHATDGATTTDETSSVTVKDKPVIYKHEPIAQLINFDFSQDLQANIPQDMTLEAANDGITHSVLITQDLFAAGDRTLINHKTYYYTAIAYAYNEYLEYAPDQVSDPGDMYAPSFYGQKKPFLAGRKNIRQYSVISHIPNAEADGTIQNAEYGTIPSMTRMEGTGNGGMELEFTTETREALLSEFCIAETGYAMDGGPVNIKVIDPLNVPQNTEFTFKMDGAGDDVNWILVNTTLNDTVFSEQTIEVKNEQIISEWGLSVMIRDRMNPGEEGAVSNSMNGFLSVSEIKDDRTYWLDYVRDTDNFFDTGNGNFIFADNWIRSGTDTTDYKNIDDGEAFEKILNGAWAPYCLVGIDGLAGSFSHSPAWKKFQSNNKFKDVSSVDIVFTDDKSLWTRCPVIETGSGSNRLNLKSDSVSVDKEGNPDDSGTNGFSWFPGYALDLEKGIRLNMMFGESSDHPDDNGTDMKWNPTSRIEEGEPLFEFTDDDPDDSYDAIFGGRHYVYIMKSAYAGSDATANPLYSNLIKMSSISKKRNVFKDAAWVSIPLLSSANAKVSDGDIEVKIRVSKAYDEYNMDDSACEISASTENAGNPHLTFNTNDIQTVTENRDAAQNAMNLIRVVPNPYYGSNNYEKDQVDHRVRITNLPKTCTISIYNVSGTLVRQVNLDSDQNVTGWDWNLKNDYNVAISSGVYIIHVDAGEIGEKVLKWFGALRPIDLDSF
jgi:hypothetical protein